MIVEMGVFCETMCIFAEQKEELNGIMSNP